MVSENAGGKLLGANNDGKVNGTRSRAARGTAAAKEAKAPKARSPRGSKAGDAKSRPTRGETRAQQIVEIAQRLFRDKGYASTSMDDIATAVGILKGSLYYYVDSKEDLLFRLVEQVHDTVTALLEEAVAREDLSPLHRITEFVRLQLRYNASHSTELAVYHHDWERLEGARYDDIRRRRLDNEASVLELIDQAKKLGEIEKTTDRRLALAHTMAVIVWPYTWYDPRSRTTADQLADSGAEFVGKALAAPGVVLATGR